MMIYELPPRPCAIMRIIYYDYESLIVYAGRYLICCHNIDYFPLLAQHLVKATRHRRS